MKSVRISLLCAATFIIAIIAWLQPIRFVDNIFYDLNFRFSAMQAGDSVVVVAIDDKSIGTVGAMPWPRSTLAQLVDRISACSPGAVVIDILFPRRDDKTGNDSLAVSFSKVKNLVLPFKAGHISEKSTDAGYTIPNDIYNSRFLRIVNQDNLENTVFYSATDIISADTLFTRSARYGGFLNVSTSVTSQKLREAVHVISVGGEYFPSLALSAVAAYRNLGQSDFVLDGTGAVFLGSERVPLTTYAGTSFINFRKGGIRTVSAADLLSGTADAGALKGKLVFVGVTDPGAGADFFLTPVSPQFPGVNVWATVALDIMQGAWIRFDDRLIMLANWLLLLLMFPGLILIIPQSRRLLLITTGTFLLIAAIILSALIFHSGHSFFDPAGHLYAWLFMLIWLALQKTVPGLGAAPALILEPSDSVDETILPPPQENDLRALLPQTDTAAFVAKSLTSAAQKNPGNRQQVFSGTIIEGNLDNLQTTITRSPEEDDITAKVREIAGGTIVRSLGSGGMADVYLIWNPRLEVYRAVKVMKPGQSPNILSRFETEVRIFSKLEHPNIVHCYSVGDWHSLPYLEMEYVNGASLEEVLSRCKFLSAEQTLAIGILVCRALQYAHSQTITIYGKSYKGIVHRDLKPANIILSRTGRIKLTDFGIARPGNVSLHTMDAGSVIGTLPYLAPEQVEGGELTARADIYALGTTMYEFLTGERAFTQTEIPAILNAKITGTFKPIAQSSRIGSDIIDIVNKSMATRLTERYADASALREDMERAFTAYFGTDGFGHIHQLVERVWQ